MTTALFKAKDQSPSGVTCLTVMRKVLGMLMLLCQSPDPGVSCELCDASLSY